jgi:hypothetical protein
MPGFWKRLPRVVPIRSRTRLLPFWKKSQCGMVPRNYATTFPSWRSSFRAHQVRVQRSGMIRSCFQERAETLAGIRPCNIRESPDVSFCIHLTGLGCEGGLQFSSCATGRCAAYACGVDPHRRFSFRGRVQYSKDGRELPGLSLYLAPILENLSGLTAIGSANVYNALCAVLVRFLMPTPS